MFAGFAALGQGTKNKIKKAELGEFDMLLAPSTPGVNADLSGACAIRISIFSSWSFTSC